MKLSVTLNIEVQLKEDSAKEYGNMTRYDVLGGGYTFVQDDELVVWKLESHQFVVFKDSWDHGDLIAILYNNEWNIFDKKTQEDTQGCRMGAFKWRDL